MPDQKKLITFEDKMAFGKYQGCEVQEIFDTDPQYLEWAMDKVKGFDFSSEDRDLIYDAAAEAKEEHFRNKENE